MGVSMSRLDAAALSLSSLCLVHCLALPLMVAALPLLGVLSEAEWVHQILVMLAVPAAIVAIATTRHAQPRFVFGALALSGCALLVAGAFVDALHDHETLLTVLGALLLACAHIYRWRTLHTH